MLDRDPSGLPGDLAAMLRPALARMTRHHAAHSRLVGEARCICGYEPEPGRKRPKTSVGIHVNNEDRKARRQYDKDAAEVIKLRGEKAGRIGAEIRSLTAASLRAQEAHDDDAADTIQRRLDVLQLVLDVRAENGELEAQAENAYMDRLNAQANAARGDSPSLRAALSKAIEREAELRLELRRRLDANVALVRLPRP